MGFGRLRAGCVHTAFSMHWDRVCEAFKEWKSARIGMVDGQTETCSYGVGVGLLGFGMRLQNDMRSMGTYNRMKLGFP